MKHLNIFQMKVFYLLTITLVIFWDVTEYLNLHSVIPLHTNVLFFPNVIDNWNSLEVDTQNQHSRLMFKKQISSNISVPSYFALGTRKYNIFQYQLRNLTSNLNQHKFLSHFSDSSRCTCGDDIEDNFHYFYVCSLFICQIILLFTQLSYLADFLNIDVLLKG